MVDMATPNDDGPSGGAAGTDEAESARRCLACGYNLFGLGDDPRCPECGLLHVPTALRQQVWELVDSGTWFFSSFFGFAQKRLPGWWWALDRPGDVRRSFKFAGRFVLLTCVLVFAAGAAADAVRVEVKWTWSYSGSRVSNAPSRSTILEVEEVWSCGLGRGIRRHERHESERKVDSSSRPQPFAVATWYAGVFEPSVAFLAQCLTYVMALVFLWAAPAMIGLWTQIRKGLPGFARAPRTIIAAANYESHRLLYLTVVVVLWMVADAVFRVVVLTNNPTLLAAARGTWAVFLLSATAMGACGWIGPLRSDYTRQLVRSRKHAVRIVLMYCVLLPWAMAFLTVAVIDSLML